MRGNLVATAVQSTGAPGRWMKVRATKGLELSLPSGMVVEAVADSETLQDMLLDDQFDDLLAPKAALDGRPGLFHLITDFESAERHYHRKTRIFQIMNLIGGRKTIAEDHPWLPHLLHVGFVAAPDLALDCLREVWLGNADRLSLPWLGATMEGTLAALGPDYWNYGLTANRVQFDPDILPQPRAKDAPSHPNKRGLEDAVRGKFRFIQDLDFLRIRHAASSVRLV